MRSRWRWKPAAERAKDGTKKSWVLVSLLAIAVWLCMGGSALSPIVVLETVSAGAHAQGDDVVWSGEH